MRALILSLLFLPAPAAAARPAFEGLKPETLAVLAECQDATYNLHFDDAEALARKAMLQAALNPLPHVFLQVAILARIQESVDAGEDDPALYARFQKESDAAMALARGLELRSPDALSQLYLGSSQGASGLAKMLNGQYLKAYHDGQAASESFRLAVARDPGLFDAYLGLGQYDYYCGRMGGFLRFVANLRGDVKGGIAMLEVCASQGGIAATAARINLARIYSLEMPDFARALPYVTEMRQRYPGNHAFVADALAMARADACASPASQALLESVYRQYDLGWRPPLYVHMNLERPRLMLARAYHAQRDDMKAAFHFARLSQSGDADMAKAGLKGLATR